MRKLIAATLLSSLLAGLVFYLPVFNIHALFHVIPFCEDQGTLQSLITFVDACWFLVYCIQVPVAVIAFYGFRILFSRLLNGAEFSVVFLLCSTSLVFFSLVIGRYQLFAGIMFIVTTLVLAGLTLHQSRRKNEGPRDDLQYAGDHQGQD